MDEFSTGINTTDAIPDPPRHQPQESTGNEIEYVSSDNSPVQDVAADTGGITWPKMGPTCVNTFNICNSSGVHIGDIHNIGTTDYKPKKLKQNLTAAEEASLLSEEPIVDDHIVRVSSSLGLGWKEVGRKLNFSDGQLEQHLIDNNTLGIKEVIYQMLLDWKQATENPTLGKLATALRDACQYEALHDLIKTAS